MSNQVKSETPELEQAGQQLLPQQLQLQAKRRRVTRACDECRKKKVKCDGQQPCIHCTVYSYECTYNHPTKRTFNSNQQTYGSSNLSSGSLNSASSATATAGATAAFSGSDASLQRHTGGNGTPVHNTFPGGSQHAAVKKYSSKSSKNLQQQLARYQQLFKGMMPDMPDIGSLDVPTFLQIFQHFKGSEPTFLDDSVKEYFLIVGDALSPSQLQSPKMSPPDSTSNSSHLKNVASSTSLADAMEQADTPQSACQMGREIKIMLPPKPVALLFVKNTWEHCCVLLRFYHRPSFIQQLDELYDTDPHNYTSEQIKFLPLCYSTIAVGALFSKAIEVKENTLGYEKENAMDRGTFLQDEGYKYFIAARKLIDITNTRDSNSIQTVLMLFIFLQCSARLSTCYAYIGVAMRSALREGFHRKVGPESDLSPLEIEIRKRLFYTIYKLDVYVNAMLGLPRSISPEDFDQVLPLELSDENITEQAYYPEREDGSLSSTGIANCHTRLIMILDTIMRKLYPIKRPNNVISHETVTNLEKLLRDWTNTLPAELKPNGKSMPPRYERANKLLHLSFLHVQIILYRPFIHFLSRNFATPVPDRLSIQRARNSITVSRTVVRMAQEMVNKNLISGSYWYACYTIFYSVAGLLFYIHEADLKDKESAREYYEILKDAETGRDILVQLKDTSMAANRTYNILNNLFDKLNSKTYKLTSLHVSPIQKKSQLADTYSAAQSDASGASSYNIEKFVTETPSLAAPDDLQSLKGRYDGIDSVTELNDNESSIGDSKEKSPEMGMENDLFLKTEATEMNPMFGFNADRNEQYLAPSINSPSFDLMRQTGNQMTPTNDNNATNSFDPAKFADGNQNSETKVKREQFDDDVGILDVFDQLDAQLFGRYVQNGASQPNQQPQVRE
ncbi:Asg1p KNAG_0E01760 [Huiozyma naganishii CBS 8797]|uniref:Zn(2)-C6 fungal-type domain-containing protein n=1 Tax=Huiozyma naganishii (strain ATCC MYA-139 / BCRC 22969 / CBS 8797 / KCTC 17520 / NBRC 10181 / NCYC 3082 / Yp74L-3) TaxID=1071383 RepID=J7RLM7_HUIN7|nr:hypothetical protein KNAG_0E01760 [Kazachstania naganishii CBS 8797]CCK70438.1 hypothetical protein KNAG_0E01760 [Kazachstania naganishii CBS 8797]